MYAEAATRDRWTSTRYKMRIMRDRIRPWLELTRLSNLPTVWSNAVTGMALGWVGALNLRSVWANGASPSVNRTVNGVPPGSLGDVLMWVIGAWLILGVSLMYAGGMVLNDVVDAERDRKLATHRPIPSGRVTRGRAGLVSLLMLGGGWLLVAVIGWLTGVGGTKGGAWSEPYVAAGWAAALVACIVGYNLFHARFPISCVLMGVCRGLIYLVAAAVAAGHATGGKGVWAATVHPVSLAMAGGLAAYVLGVTLLARHEHRRDVVTSSSVQRWFPIALLPLPLAAVVLVRATEAALNPLVGITAFGWLFWTLYIAVTMQRRSLTPVDRRGGVMGLLAFICVLDAVYLLALSSYVLAAFAALCYLLTGWGHRRISGT